MIRCDSNQRCEVCPIERLRDADSRVSAGNLARSVIRTFSEDNPTQVSLRDLRFVTAAKAAGLQAEEFTAPAIGAAAINLAGECKVEA